MFRFSKIIRESEVSSKLHFSIQKKKDISKSAFFIPKANSSNILNAPPSPYNLQKRTLSFLKDNKNIFGSESSNQKLNKSINQSINHFYSTNSDVPSRKGRLRYVFLSIALATLATIYVLQDKSNESTLASGTSEAEEIYKKIMKENGLEIRGDRFEDLYSSNTKLDVVENHPSYEMVENIITSISENDGGKQVERSVVSRIFHGFRLFFRALNLFFRFIPVIVYYKYASYRDNEETWIRFYQIILYTFRNCGALFIKLGQWASTRPDLIDINLAKVLQSLHYEGQVHSIKETRIIIKEALGKDIDEVFESFDEDVKGSGAIAQVYKAKLKSEYMPKYTEEELAKTTEKNLILSPDVAIKVKHPTVDKDVSLDLELLQLICRTISRFEHYKYMSIEENMLTFAKSMRDQLDMRIEAQNLLLFNENFKDIPNITFPNPITSLCKHSSLLVESWEEGMDVNKFVELPHDDHKDLRVALANLGIVTYLKMLIMDNFLHGDLHPGNQKIQIDPNTGDARLVILDAGLVFSLKKKDRKKLIDIFMAISDKNGPKLAFVMCSSDDRFKAFFEKQTGNTLDIQRLDKYETEMNHFIKDVFQMENKKVRVGEAFTNCLDVGRRNQIPMESVFSGIIIATAIIEGLGRRLNPEMDFVSECRPALKFCLNSDLMKQFFEQRYGGLKGVVASNIISKFAPSFFA